MKQSTRATARTADQTPAEPEQQSAPVASTTTAGGGNLAIQRLVSGRPAGAGGLGMLAGGGSGALGRLHMKLTVSQPGDPLEREADEVAERVASGTPPQRDAGPAAAGGTPPGGGDGPTDIARLAEGGDPGGAPDAGADTGGDGASPALEALVAAPGSGAPLSSSVRAAIEPHLGVPLDGVRVHSGEAAATAAASLGARAFAHGNDIFLGAGESAGDLALMAHEATHVAQRQPDLVQRSDSDSATDYVPDFILDGLRDLAREFDGYDALTVAFGYDPIAGQEVARTPENVVNALLKLVPFGEAMAGVLGGLSSVMRDAVTMIDSGLTEHNLTRERLSNEIDQAWNELDPLEGMDNIDIITRHIQAVLTDVEAFVRSILDAVVELIREAAVGLAEDHLADSELWVLATEVLGRNPLTDENVDAPPAQILADFLRFIEQEDVLAQLQERNQLDTTATWLAVQITRFTGLVGELILLFEAAWAAIQPSNIGNLYNDLSTLAQNAIGLVGRITAFGAEIMAAALEFVKDSLLGYLSEQAADVPGYPLLTVLIEEDPFTDKPVQRTPEALIGGFIKLMPDGEQTYQKLSESGAIGQAAGRIEGAIGRLGISPQMIADTFLGIWDSVSLEDLLDPGAAYDRVIARFGDPLNRIIEFVGEVVKAVVTVILEAMNFPSQLLGNIVGNAMSAIEDIQNDPVGFLLNMLEALKGGLSGFFDNFLTYLTQGLTDWLFRGLDDIGVTAPSELTLEAVLDLVMQVLGVTSETLWTKLGERIGPERVEQIRSAIDTATGAWAFIKDVQENGPAAIWEYVSDQLSGLWDTLLTKAKDWIVTEIVEAVAAKLISMLDPTGVMAVVNSFVAFFNAVESAIEYLTEILQIVDQYVATLAAVAKGDTGPGAQMIERGLANAVPVAIGFMANQAGIGNIPEKIVEIIQGIRELIDQALDWLFDQAMSLGQAALTMLSGPSADPAAVDPATVAAAGADPAAGTDPAAAAGAVAADVAGTGDPEHDAKVAAGVAALTVAEQAYLEGGTISKENAEKVVAEVHQAHPIFSLLHVVDGEDNWDYEYAASPKGKKPGGKKKPDPDRPGVSAPGLGRIGKHGSKPPSNRTGREIHWLESEHVIPFATGKRLWDMLALVTPGRGGHEDRGQTTIMIYEGAARIKTPVDNQVSDAFEAALARSQIARRMRTARVNIDAGNDSARAEAQELLALLMQGMRVAKEDAVKRTVEAIAEENESVEDGFDETNGERRAEPPGSEPALPAEAGVEAAADQQYDDVVELVEEAVEAVNILS